MKNKKVSSAASMTAAQFHAKIDAFIASWAALEDDRVEHCKKLVELVEHDRFALRYINQQCPKLSIQKLKLMERVGRGDYHPALLTPSTPGESMLALMDYQEQVRGLEAGGTIPVATLDEKTGEFGVRLLPLTSLTTDQVNQVSRLVKKQRVYISMDEQKAWLIDHRTNLATRPSRKDKPKWIIKDGNAIIGGIVMTPAELTKAATEALCDAAEPVVSVTEVKTPATQVVVEEPPTAEKRKPRLGDLLKNDRPKTNRPVMDYKSVTK